MRSISARAMSDLVPISMRSSLSRVMTVTALSLLLKPMRCIGHIVQHDHVEFFANQFGARVCDRVFGLCREADDEGACAVARNRRDDVWVLHQVERNAGVTGLFDLLRLRLGRSIVGDCGDADKNVALVELLHDRVVHLLTPS